MKKLPVLLLLLLGAVPLFSLSVQRETPVSATELAPTPYARHAQIATDGETYVAVWTDYRSTPISAYAGRVRADGTLLDPVGIRVAPNSQAGAVIWSGETFLIAYLQEGMVKVRTFSPDGVLGEPIELFGSYVLTESYQVRMATNGDSVLLITSDATASLLELDGRERRQISFPWVHAQRGLGVAAAGSTYLVAVGASTGSLRTQIVTAEGDFGASRVLQQNMTTNGVEVASDGERFLVAWSRGNLHAQFVTREGVPVEPVLALTAVDPVQFYTHAITGLVRRGGEYLLMYQTWEGAPFDTMRLGDDGQNRGPLLTGFGGPLTDIVLNGEGGAVLGHEANILSVAFFDAGAPAPLRNRTRVSIAGKRQREIRLASDGGGLAAAWVAVLDWDDTDIMLSRPGSPAVMVDAAGGKLIDTVFESGTIWVLWQRETKLYARRFTQALQPIDAEPVLFGEVLEGDDVELAAAAGGSAVAVVYNVPLDGYGYEPEEEAHIGAYVLRGTAAGIGVTATPIASEPGYDRLPRVAWGGDTFTVVWANATGYYISARREGGGIGTNDRSSSYKPDDRILMARVAASGALLDTNPREIARSKHLHALAIADGVLVWQTYRTPDLSSRQLMYAARAVPNATVVELGGEDMLFGAFASDSGGFLLTRARVLDSSTLAPEVLTLDASLAVTARIGLQLISVDIMYLSMYPEVNPYDADVIGGPMRAIGYARIAEDEYGHANRVYVRRLVDTPRRRALR
ncbi:MAG TPA: hypothetical protein VF432_26420 [Thermoanaerobaculia bacterium]